jgi:uncharacterized protein
VIYDWDPPKNARTLRERGFDFAFATQIFDGPYVEYDDDRADYGERRVIAIGLADETPLTVVYTDRLSSTGGPVRWIISARISHRKERRRYAETLAALRALEDPDAGPR